MKRQGGVAGRQTYKEKGRGEFQRLHYKYLFEDISHYSNGARFLLNKATSTDYFVRPSDIKVRSLNSEHLFYLGVLVHLFARSKSLVVLYDFHIEKLKKSWRPCQKCSFNYVYNIIYVYISL